MPDFVTTNPEYVEFITGKDGVLRKWLRLGASGWRLDVADELPNEFLKAIRKAVKEECPENLLMGEVWDDPSNKYNYGHLMEYFWGEELDCTMNYPFRAAVLPFVIGDCSAFDFCRRFMSLAENYPPENFYGSLNLLGSHDRERVMNILGGYPLARYGFDHETQYHDLTEEEYELARKRYKMLSILQYTLPGVPDIYYGDETGVQGGSDPDCRRTYPWGKEDTDLVNHFRWLGRFYHEHPCLKNGGFELSPVSDDVLALERFDGHERILIMINRSDQYLNVLYKGKTYTPKSFFESTGLKASDYISLTSFSHHPFYQPFVLEIQDNWRWAQSYNLPLDEFMQVFDYAINNGYTIAWGADVSEEGFTRNGIGIVPDVEKAVELSGSDMAHWLKLTPQERDLTQKPGPEKWVTQQERQLAYDNWETTDDHGMQIYGLAKDQNGTEYYMVKNSWGKSGKYDGLWYVSKAFVRYKTINILVNKKALPKEIAKKLGVNL